MADNKVTYAQRGREIATALALLMNDLSAWRNTYWDRTYNASGADELTDADIAETGVSAADVTGLTTFADGLDAFMASNRPYISNMRQDM
jgi:hypothetical protein